MPTRIAASHTGPVSGTATLMATNPEASISDVIIIRPRSSRVGILIGCVKLRS
jgi:hypothetical protein